MDIALTFVWILLACSLGYTLVAGFCVLKFTRRLRRHPAVPEHRPRVTLYKPLHGLDFGMRDNLLSFCRQDYPDFEVIFGVSEETDPALAIVREVIAASPGVTTHLTIDAHVNGANPKISNLINMDAAATGEILIISDSDMRVEADYIDRIVAGFNDERVGLVTCLYKGIPAPGLASELGAMFINQWFAPSALIPATFGGTQHCFGATMAIKRGLLTEIGGLHALVGNLADDYTLGRLVRDAGHEVRLADVVVGNVVEEDSIKSLILHELRWARTIRSVEPIGYALTFLTDTVPLGVVTSGLSLVAGTGAVMAALPLVLAILARTALNLSTKGTFSSNHAVSIPAALMRDILYLYVRLKCYAGKTVNWRDSRLSVDKGGEIQNLTSHGRDVDEHQEDTVSKSSVV